MQNDTIHQVESYSYILFDFCKVALIEILQKLLVMTEIVITGCSVVQ